MVSCLFQMAPPRTCLRSIELVLQGIRSAWYASLWGWLEYESPSTRETTSAVGGWYVSYGEAGSSPGWWNGSRDVVGWSLALILGCGLPLNLLRHLAHALHIEQRSRQLHTQRNNKKAMPAKTSTNIKVKPAQGRLKIWTEHSTLILLISIPFKVAQQKFQDFYN